MSRVWRFGDDVNTDQIVPGRYAPYMTSEAELRKYPFIEARPEFAATVQPGDLIVAGRNFGCGSSREHAPWALMDFGIRCVVSTSFADIFYNNCFQNGLLPVVLKADEVQQLMDEARGGNHVVSVDLEAQTVTSPSGAVFGFDIDPKRKAKMLGGLDAIGETLTRAGDIDVFEMKRALSQPWLEEA
ncbi:MAG TPA: 3-isopropylmalate dehydratase small subunit [Chloroflexia bacterium]